MYEKSHKNIIICHFAGAPQASPEEIPAIKDRQRILQIYWRLKSGRADVHK